MPPEIDTTTPDADVSVHEKLMQRFTGEETLPSNEAEAPVEEVASTDVVDDEAAAGTDTEATDSESVETDEGDSDSRWMPESLDELAEALEVPRDELMAHMRLQTKVDGEVGEATLQETLNNFQFRQSLDRRSQQFASERKEWEEQQEKSRQAYEQKVQEADDTLSAMEQILAAEYQQVDWNELQQEDPTQYLLTQQALQQRFMQLQTAKDQLKARREEESKASQEKDLEAARSRLYQERDLAIDKIPEWRDQKVAAADVKRIGEYLSEKIGYRPEELAHMADHRDYVVARKAMLYDEMQAKAAPKKEQLRTKPNFVKPGARKAASSAKTKKIAELKAKSRRGDKAATRELLKLKMYGK